MSFFDPVIIASDEEFLLKVYGIFLGFYDHASVLLDSLCSQLFGFFVIQIRSSMLEWLLLMGQVPKRKRPTSTKKQIHLTKGLYYLQKREHFSAIGN
jgi:hypothetical protein